MDIAAVLTDHFPGCRAGVDNNDYATLRWDESNPVSKPTLEDLESLWPGVELNRKWTAIRMERDRLLASSDWTQVPDSPVDQAVWASYRQTLRNVPQDFDSPDDVVWPEKP